jgi:hypothetical protein
MAEERQRNLHQQRHLTVRPFSQLRYRRGYGQRRAAGRDRYKLHQCIGVVCVCMCACVHVCHCVHVLCVRWFVCLCAGGLCLQNFVWLCVCICVLAHVLVHALACLLQQLH